MSLTLEELSEAYKEWSEIEKRLVRLMGFSPATSNHYGRIRMYNQCINSKTSDEELLRIRSAFLKWKKDIVELLEERGIIVDDVLWNRLFSLDCMYGELSFLNVEVDIYSNVDKYRIALDDILNAQEPLEGDKEYYRNLLKGR